MRRGRHIQMKNLGRFFGGYCGTVEESTGFGASQIWFQIRRPPWKVF